ncbi:hypothetical protein ACLMJK_001727 [Lecanora helva]
MPHRVPFDNAITKLFGLGDLDKIERQLEQRRWRKRNGYLPFDEANAQMFDHQMAMQARRNHMYPSYPYKHRDLHPTAEQFALHQAFNKMSRLQLSPSELDALCSAMGSHSASDRTGVDAWTSDVVHSFVRKHAREIIMLMGRYPNQQIDPNLMPTDRKRDWSKALLKHWQRSSHHGIPRSPRHGPFPPDVYRPMSDSSGSYYDGLHEGRHHRHRSRVPPPLSPLGFYDSDENDYLGASEYAEYPRGFNPVRRSRSEDDLYGFGGHRRHGF